MTKILTFGDAPLAPYSELEDVIKRERLEREQARTEAQTKTVDNSLLISESTVPATQPGPVPGRGIRAINDDAGNVTIESNYMRFDLDVFRAIRDMTYGEQGIYLDLIRRAYGAYPKARNLCSCTYAEMTGTSGVTSRDSISNAISSLEAKGYIRRLITAYKKGDKSLYRVYLPCEIMGNDSRTKITISNRD